MDEIEKAALLARSRELIDKLYDSGVLRHESCVNGHSGAVPTELGLFAWTILKDWFGESSVEWPTEVVFVTQCPDCPELPGQKLASGIQ